MLNLLHRFNGVRRSKTITNQDAMLVDEHRSQQQCSTTFVHASSTFLLLNRIQSYFTCGCARIYTSKKIKTFLFFFSRRFCIASSTVGATSFNLKMWREKELNGTQRGLNREPWHMIFYKKRLKSMRVPPVSSCTLRFALFPQTAPPIPGQSQRLKASISVTKICNQETLESNHLNGDWD